MRLRLLILAGVFAAGLAAPAAAGEVRWIDPWAPHNGMPELAGGPRGQAYHHYGHRHGSTVVWIDPWAGDADCAEQGSVVTGAASLAGFNGGVGNRGGVAVFYTGSYFKPSLPAGQVPMTGARAAPVHPLGGPRF